MSRKLDPEQYNRLKAESKAPYKPLRKFVYITCGASGFIGAVVFISQLVAGQSAELILPNLALQLGVIATMILFWKLENRSRR